ncbi:DEAD/DEAH box helicase domain protein [Gluconacetobacter diazotrophicus PA1 5]|uniref:DEAD-box ATP-dependent RNA helicase RhpA n=2 Tax=Gluconacetobacter diazotrophicus TaxID=33996 RepID=A9H0S9_GLUDA|nr:DEAD/DEAH box helicase [Gluconacetobacter diazotrophicus]ACI52867.1 DEAD/DEAH box helicase domain protein [Gluconacetobacter diazotrophicus PA1 5]MBB2155394.1 DEAD/DEAH box helicase [Gluconacetobacter diazotrophicus]TWB08988.1 ATP-dependent RNA helicase RhlE [Gluconacetobacter diazotrophicus]CAP57168.1 putative cold-shock DEAD box protein A [Gluconacetobacter diazotrophicus PA1 5]
MTTFADLQLAEPLLRALNEEGYTTPTPIQAGAIPHLLAGRDLLGLAQTGTGKTAAFALPILQRLLTHHRRANPKGARVLVLAPTRELASQIDESFKSYARHMRLSHTVIFGGVGQGRQVEAMRRGVDVLVAAPGRLLDLMGQGHIDLSGLEVLVLDEADRMLDMGFVRDIRRIVAELPRDRQTLLFSATMPKSIADLAHGLLRDPATVQVTPPSSTVDRIRQAVMFVDTDNKRAALQLLVDSPKVERAVVFTLMKHEANKVAAFLNDHGIIAEAIHGNKSQGARERAMAGFRSGAVKVLVATDIAARGIDVDDVTHVFNYDLPNVPESYVHRIGRTARAGRDGWAVSLCDAEQRAWLRDIEKAIGKKIPVVQEHPYHSEAAENSTLRPPVLGGGGGRGRGGGGGGRHQQRQGGGHRGGARRVA